MNKVFLFIAIMLLACEKPEANQKTGKKAAKDGMIKQFYPGGKIKSEIEYKNGKRHGLAKRYYKNGQVHQEITYLNNVKDGEAKTYYENGQLYQLTPYENGYIQGYRLKYRDNGDLMAEIPYHYGEPCQGMIEYLLNGKRKKQYPSIEVTYDDQILRRNKYTLRFRMSEKMQKVQFYEGTLDNDGCMLNELENFYSPQPGLAEISFELQPGSFIMKEFTVVAKGKTILGNPFITERRLNLALENPGM
ncbi:MAG: toxin-antitoxin system YwqK family antitoxin [Bacteroidota bacterium]